MEIDCGVCTLRRWRTGDEGSLVRHANDVEVWRGLRDRFPHPYTLADAEEWVRAGSRTGIHFAFDTGGEAVGGITLMPGEDVERCSAEVGYWLGRAHWGRGIATAALVALTEHAFAEHPLTRVFAVPFATSAASMRVLEKAGYQREGVLRRSAIKEGRVVDQVMYASVR